MIGKSKQIKRKSPSGLLVLMASLKRQYHRMLPSAREVGHDPIKWLCFWEVLQEKRIARRIRREKLKLYFGRKAVFFDGKNGGNGRRKTNGS